MHLCFPMIFFLSTLLDKTSLNAKIWTSKIPIMPKSERLLVPLHKVRISDVGLLRRSVWALMYRTEQKSFGLDFRRNFLSENRKRFCLDFGCCPKSEKVQISAFHCITSNNLFIIESWKKKIFNFFLFTTRFIFSTS